MTRESRSTVILEGIYKGHPKGFGFFRPLGQGPDRKSLRDADLFVPRDQAGEAIDGDRVRARPGDRGTARVVEVLERGRARLAGTWVEGGHFRPDSHAIPRVLPLTLPPGRSGAPLRPGMKVIAAARGGGFVLETVLGRSGDPEVEDRSVLLEMAIAGEFPPEVLREAARFEGASVGSRDRVGRMDLRSETVIVTIDPLTAKDFDDAISLRRGKDGSYILGVHIADVGHYVAPGSALDREAESRGSSAYLPARVVPMLPPALSDGLCSLREGQDRLAQSVLLTYDRKGNLKEAQAARSVIRSARRFTYERASRVMEGAGGESRDVARLLKEMFELARMLRARRPSLMIHEPEVEFVYTPQGDIADVCTTEGDAAHWVIEEFMLSANREIAGWLLRLGEPVLFRHHPPHGSLEELRDFLDGMGIRGAREGALPDLLRQAEAAGLGAAATSFVMEAMEAAEYNPREPRHDALGFPWYTHFTSPIRRYADLVVHRAAAKHLRPGRWMDLGLKAGTQRPPIVPASTPELERLAIHINRRERAIAYAERRLRRRRILEFIAKRSGEPLPGVVSRTLENGLLVNLPGFLISGFLEAASLGSGARRTGPHKMSAGGKTWRPGQEISVRVKRIDPLRGELDFIPA